METALVFELGTVSRVNRLERAAGGTKISGADFGEGGIGSCALALGIALAGGSFGGGALKGTLIPSSPGGSLRSGVGLVGMGTLGGDAGDALPSCWMTFGPTGKGAVALFFFSGSRGGGDFALLVPA